MNDFGTLVDTGGGSFGYGEEDETPTSLICHKQKTTTTVTIETGDLIGSCCYNITTSVQYIVNIEEFSDTSYLWEKNMFTCAEKPKGWCEGSESTTIEFDRPDGTYPGNIGDTNEETWAKAFCAAMNPPSDDCGGFSNPPESSFSIIMTTYTETCYNNIEYQNALEDGSINPPGHTGNIRRFPCGGVDLVGSNNSLGLKVVGKIAACICDIMKGGFDLTAKLNLMILMASIQDCATKRYPNTGTKQGSYIRYQRCLDAIPCPQEGKAP